MTACVAATAAENVSSQIATFEPSRPVENSITADRKQNLLTCAQAPNSIPINSPPAVRTIASPARSINHSEVKALELLAAICQRIPPHRGAKGYSGILAKEGHPALIWRNGISSARQYLRPQRNLRPKETDAAMISLCQSTFGPALESGVTSTEIALPITFGALRQFFMQGSLFQNCFSVVSRSSS